MSMKRVYLGMLPLLLVNSMAVVSMVASAQKRDWFVFSVAIASYLMSCFTLGCVVSRMYMLGKLEAVNEMNEFLANRWRAGTTVEDEDGSKRFTVN